TATLDSIRSNISRNMFGVFGGQNPLTPMDSSALGINHRFDNFHWSWYNRHSTQGHEAPIDVHPFHCKKVHVTHTNYTQLTPRLSVETRQYNVIYHNMEIIFDDLFDWNHDLVHKFFPEDYNSLSEFCNELPLDARPACYPLSALVVNLDVTTKGHRGRKDHLLCVIISWGTHKGGGLGLFELGLVFNTNAGDTLIIRSYQLTHFNLHFNGERGSIVLHANASFHSWIKDRNRWEENMFMNS
ncbi:hypothetical protein JAAARDRAFT_141616, partial [Jaapia argillacea MUCL 33604]